MQDRLGSMRIRGLCKQEEARIQLSTKQHDWILDSDEEPIDHELEAHYMYMAKIQEVIPAANEGTRPVFDKEPLEQCDSNTTPDSSDMSNNGGEADQDEQKFQEEQSSNKVLQEANTSLGNELERYQNMKCVKDVEFECAKAYGLLEEQRIKSEKSFDAYTLKIHDLNQKLSKMEKQASAHQTTISTLSSEKEELKQFYKTREDNEIEKVINLKKHVNVLNDIVYKTDQSVQTMNMLNSKCTTSFVKPRYLKKAQSVKNEQLYVPIISYASENVVNFETTLKEEVVEDLRYFNSLEKEVESLKSQLQRQKIEFSKSTDRLLEEYFSKDLMCAILRSFADIDECTELQCLYLEKCQECESLEIELNKSKTQQTDKRFANLEQHCINLELALQHEKEKNVCENSWVKQSLISGDTEKALKDKNDSLIAELNRKTLESHDLRAQLQDKIIAYAELRERMNQSKGKSVETKLMILTTNTPYPSRKIRRIRACTHQRPQRKEDQYAVSREDQYAVLDIWHVNILEDIKRGPYSKKLQYAVSNPLDTPYRTDFQTL
ncbi:hypothetical protein Tco_0060696 [Tanacetum coccineum]